MGCEKICLFELAQNDRFVLVLVGLLTSRGTPGPGAPPGTSWAFLGLCRLLLGVLGWPFWADLGAHSGTGWALLNLFADPFSKNEEDDIMLHVSERIDTEETE